MVSIDILRDWALILRILVIHFFCILNFNPLIYPNGFNIEVFWKRPLNPDLFVSRSIENSLLILASGYKQCQLAQ